MSPEQLEQIKKAHFILNKCDNGWNTGLLQQLEEVIGNLIGQDYWDVLNNEAKIEGDLN